MAERSHSVSHKSTFISMDQNPCSQFQLVVALQVPPADQWSFYVCQFVFGAVRVEVACLVMNLDATEKSGVLYVACKLFEVIQIRQQRK